MRSGHLELYLLLLPMKFAQRLEHLGVGAFVHVKVDKSPDILLDRRSFFLFNGSPLRWIDVVHCILDQHSLLLPEVLGGLLPLQCL